MADAESANSNRWVRPAIVGALVVGAFLRLYDLDLVSVTADEGIHGLFARNVALLDFDKYPMVGLPSVGIRNSALFVYLLALPNFIYLHPLSGAAFIAGLHVWAIWLAFRLGRDHFGAVAGVVAAWWFACSPWSVLYARNMWPPSAVTPFALLFVGAALAWFKTGGGRPLFWAIALAFVLPQIHFSGFCAPVWLVVVLLCGMHHWRWRKAPTVGLAALLGVITWAPWLHWQHYSNRWQDFAQLLRAAKGQNEFSFGRVFEYYYHLLGAGGLNYWFRTPVGELPAYFPAWLPAAQITVGAIALLAMAGGVVVAVRSAVGRLLILWSLLPTAMLTVLRPVVHPHYEFIAFPIPFVLVGAFVASLNPRARLATSVATVGILCVFLTTLVGWRNYVASGNLDGDDRYQLSYRQRATAVRFVIQDAHQRLVEIVGPFSGQQPAYAWPYAHEALAAESHRHGRNDEYSYWMDELKGDGLPAEVLADLGKYPPYYVNVTVAKQFNVGATRIFLLHGTKTSPRGNP